MNKMKVIMAFCGCLLLAACSGAKSDAKRAVLSQLKDPDSAKFGIFTQVDDKHACFGVNARNSMGGYTGEQQATLVKDDKGWSVVNFANFSHETCVEVMKNVTATEEATKQFREAMMKRYVVTNLDVVIDNKTRLMWAKNSNIADKKMKWKEAMTWAQNLNHAGKTGWRLPTKEEWEEFDGRKIDNPVFANYLYTNTYWTSSSYEGNTKSAWEAGGGTTRISLKDSTCYAWPVRAAQ